MNDLDMIQKLRTSVNKNQIVKANNRTTEVFTYSQVDPETAEYLKNKRAAIEVIVHRTRGEIGAILIEAQERLSRRGYGCFGAWCESMGLARQKAYDYINYNKLLVENPDKYELIENLQPSLAGEIAKPNAPQELKDKVLSGEIDKHKEYKAELEALKAKLSSAEKELAEAKEDNMTLFGTNKELYTKLDAEKKKTLEPTPPADYQQIKETKLLLESQLQQAFKKIEHLNHTLKAQEEAQKAQDTAGQVGRDKIDLIKDMESKAASMRYLVESFDYNSVLPEQRKRLVGIGNALYETSGKIDDLLKEVAIEAEVISDE